MRVIEYSPELTREDLQGVRWLILNHSMLSDAIKLMMFAELDGVLIAIDHRGKEVEKGMWMRMVHLLLVDDAKGVENSGITKVVEGDFSIEELLF